MVEGFSQNKRPSLRKALPNTRSGVRIRDQGFETITGAGKPIERGFYNASFRNVLKSVLKVFAYNVSENTADSLADSAVGLSVI